LKLYSQVMRWCSMHAIGMPSILPFGAGFQTQVFSFWFWVQFFNKTINSSFYKLDSVSIHSLWIKTEIGGFEQCWAVLTKIVRAHQFQFLHHVTRTWLVLIYIYVTLVRTNQGIKILKFQDSRVLKWGDFHIYNNSQFSHSVFTTWLLNFWLIEIKLNN